jgi:LmbE family N-acetylglucosaminyl deacetylase
VLAAGALMARYAREGHAVHVAILGEGLTSRSVTREDALARAEMQGALEELRRTIRRAADILGCASTRSFSLSDNRFDSVDLLSVVKIVEELKTQTQPTIVLTHHVGDMNVDHGVVANAVLTAFRSLPGESPCQIYAGEVLSSTDYSIGVAGRMFEPNVWVPVGRADVEKKMKALEAYASEIREYPHPRSSKAVETLAGLRGTQCGHPFAEAFRLLRGWGSLPGAESV